MNSRDAPPGRLCLYDGFRLTRAGFLAILNVHKMTTGMKDEKGSQNIGFLASITINSVGAKSA